MQFATRQTLAQRVELLVETLDSFDQRQHEVMQQLALAGQHDASPTLDQLRAEFLLQCTQLQAH